MNRLKLATIHEHIVFKRINEAIILIDKYNEIEFSSFWSDFREYLLNINDISSAFAQYADIVVKYFKSKDSEFIIFPEK